MIFRMNDEEMEAYLEKIEAYLDENGAATPRQIAQSLLLDRPATEKLLALGVIDERWRWAAGLPKQAVWFIRPREGAHWGMIEARRVGKPQGPRKKTLEMKKSILVDLDAGGELSYDELAEALQKSRDVVRRLLREMEQENLVECRVWKTGNRGRPTFVWRLAGSAIADNGEITATPPSPAVVQEEPDEDDEDEPHWWEG